MLGSKQQSIQYILAFVPETHSKPYVGTSGTTSTARSAVAVPNATHSSAYTSTAGTPRFSGKTTWLNAMSWPFDQ